MRSKAVESARCKNDPGDLLTGAGLVNRSVIHMEKSGGYLSQQLGLQDDPASWIRGLAGLLTMIVRGHPCPRCSSVDLQIKTHYRIWAPKKAFQVRCLAGCIGKKVTYPSDLSLMRTVEDLVISSRY